MPRSVKYILALGLVVGFIAIIPFFSHLFGYHCDSNRQVLKTGIFSWATNIDIAFTDTGQQLNGSPYIPYSIRDGEVKTCVQRINFSTPTSVGVVTPCESYSTNCFYALQSPPTTGWFEQVPKCVYCDDYQYLQFKDNNGNKIDGFDYWYCISNATKKPKSEIGSDWSGLCNYDNCALLPSYNWSNKTGLATCTDQSICGVNGSYSSEIIDLKLKEAGAVRVYTESSRNAGYKNAISIKCDKKLSPQIALYSVEIFNASIWVMLYVAAVLFFFLQKIKSH